MHGFERLKLGALDRLPPLMPGTISVLMKWLINVQCHMQCPVLESEVHQSRQPVDLHRTC